MGKYDRVALGLVLLALVLMLTSSWNDAPCFDEPEHATAGYTTIHNDQLWMNPFHPPLWKDIAGAALCTVAWNPPSEEWNVRDSGGAVTRFFFTAGNDPQSIIRVARAPLILLGALFIGLYYLLLKDEFGERTALGATAMLAISPSYLAHARLVCTDSAAALACFIALTMLARHRRQNTRLSLALLGATTGAALLMKFSTLILLPCYALGWWWWPDREPSRFARDACATVVACLVAIGLGYGLTPTPAAFQLRYNSVVLKDQADPLLQLMRSTEESSWLRPWSWYATGLYAQGRHVQKGHDLPTFLNGDTYQGGRPRYFPILLLSKEPAGFLILLALALCSLKRPNPTLKAYLTFVLLYLVVALNANLNMGIRHVLPVLPFLYLFIAWALENRPKPAIVCWSWALLATLAAWPGYLSYFNEFVGGKARGPRVALDSNYDWGQDLLRLRLYLDSEKIDHVYLLYFGRNDAKCYLGTHYQPLTEIAPSGSVLAVSGSYYCEAKYTGPQAQEALARRLQISLQTLRWMVELPVLGQAGDTITLLRVP